MSTSRKTDSDETSAADASGLPQRDARVLELVAAAKAGMATGAGTLPSNAVPRALNDAYLNLIGQFTDAGSRDAGSRDAGSRDAGSRDAGSRDAGSRALGSHDGCMELLSEVAMVPLTPDTAALVK